MKVYLDEIYKDFKKVIAPAQNFDKEEQLRIKKELEEKLVSELNFEDFRKANKIAEQQSQKWFDRFGGKNDKRRYSRNFNKLRK